jgi:hypothetical protein
MPARARPVLGPLTLLFLICLLPLQGRAQAPDGYRIGLTFGGTSAVGLAFEIMWGDAAVDLSIGTWAFRDIAVSAVGKYYVGSDEFKGFGGGGLWYVTQFPAAEGERRGEAWVLRFPIGAEGRINSYHAPGLEINLDRAISVERSDPDDDRPPTARIIPLPGVYYRYALNRPN